MRKNSRRKRQFITKEPKNKRTYIDDLFLRIFLSSLILLVFCSLDKFLPRFGVTKYLNTNFNIVKFAKIFSGTPLEIVNEDDLITVYEPDIYDQVEYLDGINYVTNNTYAGVDNLVTGYVVKVSKVNNRYTVVIKGVDDIEYCYGNLESIDVSLYAYVYAKETIGKALFEDGKYHFELVIDQNGEKLDFYDN